MTEIKNTSAVAEAIADKNQKSKTLLVIAVMVLASVSAFWSLSDGTLNNHECFVSIAAREMLRTNDYVMPRYNGEIRLEKTPLSYWLTAYVAKITGKVNEFSSRLPSALFAILSAAAIIYFVSQWLGIRIAAISAAVWVSTVAFFKFSHSARPEMALCSLVTISMLSFYSAMEAQSKKQRVLYMLIFWTGFALSMLAKGPAPLVLVAPPIFLYFALFKQWKRIKDCLPIIGPVLFLLIVLPWPIMVTARAPGGLMFWKREFIDRFMGDYAAGHKPFWYYLPVTFLLVAPFSAFVPYVVFSPFYSVWERKRHVMWYLWLWFVVQILVMTVSGGKREHYILSAFPAFSIIAGICLYDMIFGQKAFSPKQAKTFFMYHIVIVLPAAAAFLYWVFTKRQSYFLPAVHIVMMITLVLGLVIFLFCQRRKVAATVLLFAGYCTILITIYVYMVSPFGYNSPSEDFSTKIGQIVPQNEELIAFNYLSARTIHYTGRNIPETNNLNEARFRYDTGAWVIATGDDYQDMLKAGGFEPVLYRAIAERHGSRDVEGGLFHKGGVK